MNNNNYKEGFDFEFMSDEEVYEELRRVVRQFAEDERKKDKTRIEVTNPLRIRQMQFTYKLLKFAFKDSDVNVTYNIDKTVEDMGWINVTGREIFFGNPGWFFTASDLATNVEVLAHKKGTVSINFTFYDLASSVTIEKGEGSK